MESHRRTIKVKTRKEFVSACNSFKEPILVHGFGESDLLSYFWIVEDEALIGGLSVELPGCRLSYTEYDNSLVEKYEERKRCNQIRYENWMCHLWGEHYRQMQLD